VFVLGGDFTLGARNRTQRPGRCDGCGYVGWLSSWTLQHWTLAILPVPYRSGRVVDACPSCGRSPEILAADWERLGRQVADAPEPEDAEGGIRRHADLAYFGYRPKADAWFETLLERHSREPAVLEYAGRVLWRRGRRQEALEKFQEAYRLDPSLRYAADGVAALRIFSGELEGAGELLDPQHSEPDVLAELGYALQRAGRSHEAVQVLRNARRRDPQISLRKEFAAALWAAERAAGVPLTRLPRRIGKAGVTALILLLLALPIAGIVALDRVTANRRTLHVVNGYRVAAQVQVGGKRVEVPPGSRVTVKVPEGTHRAVVEGPLSTTHDLSIEGSFFERLAGRRLFILNLGGEAVLMRESNVYAVKEKDREYRMWQLYGETFLVLADIDFPFREFPDEITLPSTASKATRTRIELANLDEIDVFAASVESGMRAQAVGYAEWRMRRAPDDADRRLEFVRGAWTHGLVAEGTRWLEEWREREGGSDDWHLEVQGSYWPPEALERLRAWYDRQAAGPTPDPRMVFFRARLEPRIAAILAVCESLLGQGHESELVLRTAGTLEARRGNWEAAIERLLRARRAAGDGCGVSSELVEALIAAGRLREAEALVREGIEANPLDWGARESLILTLAAAGRADEALQAPEDYRRAYAAEGKDPEESGSESMRCFALMALGRHESALELAAADPDLRWERHLALLALGRVDEAIAAVPFDDDLRTEVYEFLWVAIALKALGRPEENRWRERAAEWMTHWQWGKLAACLTAGPPPDVDALLDADLTVESKLPLLVCVGQRFPERAGPLFKAARALCVSRRFPADLLRRAMGD
jgi:tetratricopeptide (TPR) repeat protein